MKIKWMFSLLAIAVVFAVSGRAAAKPQSATAAGTAFTYQGRLIDAGSPADGAYDFAFKLFDADVGGSQVAGVIAPEDVPVVDGLFTVQLDFGAVYDGSVRFLEIGVRPGASTGAYTILGPRQRLNPMPYALNAFTAPWTGLTGIPAGFADGLDDNTTYTKGLGLLLTGTQFSVDTSAIQARVAATCAAGNAIRAIDATGGVTCQSIAYSHNHWGQTWSGTGTGLTLSGGSTGLHASATSYGLYGETTSVGGAGIFAVGPSGGGNYAGMFMGNVQVYGHQVVTGAGTTLASSGGDIGLDGAGSTSGVVGSAVSSGGTGIVGNAYGNSGDYAGVFNGNVAVNGNETVYGSGVTLFAYGGTTGVDASGDTTGVYAVGNTYGIDALGSTAVHGMSNAQTQGVGVYGSSSGGQGIGVYGLGSGMGVRGESGNAGVFGKGNPGVLGWAAPCAGCMGVFGRTDSGTGDYAGYFFGNVYVQGNFTADGTKSAAVKTQTYGTRALYAVESPENWFEDFGSGQLVNGKAVITIDPVFAQTVNLNDDYHVFLTPRGDCPLFVDRALPTSFSVRAMDGRTCSITFDYRIVAKRLGYEDLRLAVSGQAAAPVSPTAPDER